MGTIEDKRFGINKDRKKYGRGTGERIAFFCKKVCN
jgi:hypothetical protein